MLFALFLQAEQKEEAGKARYGFSCRPHGLNCTCSFREKRVPIIHETTLADRKVKVDKKLNMRYDIKKVCPFKA